MYAQLNLRLSILRAVFTALLSFCVLTPSWPQNPLLPVFDDTKKPVRLTAAAAYINATSPSHTRGRI
jgi:hypothetical protein